MVWTALSPTLEFVAKGGGDRHLLGKRFLAWFDLYVKGDRALAAGPQFTWWDSQGGNGTRIAIRIRRWRGDQG